MVRVGIATLSSVCLVITAVAAAWPDKHSKKPAIAAETAPATKATTSGAPADQKAPEATSTVKKQPSKKCAAGQLKLRAAECPKGARCRPACVNKPKDGPSLLCPEGRIWEAMPCPKGARCLIGGRCVVAGSKTRDSSRPSSAKTKDPVKSKAPLVNVSLKEKHTAKCKTGRVPTRVQCARAPCDTLCLPARLDPSLKASPKVKAL